MSISTDRASTASDTAEPFLHLPDVIRMEDTVASIRGGTPPDPSGEQNAFIAAAVNAGG